MTGISADPAHAEPTGERFMPDLMGGHLIEAEHFVRYAWASQFAAGRRTLDAACGTGYGTRALAAAGATEAVGIDRDEGVIAKLKRDAPSGVRFEVGDLLGLPFEDDEFDLVVCFEAIEHVDEPSVVLDELRRVLRPDGLLAISTPNRDVYQPGNPFHLRELTPSEFKDELGERFESVVLRRQHTWIASALLDDEAFRSEENAPLDGVELQKAQGHEPGTETYTVALAGGPELPDDRGFASLTVDVDIRDWSTRMGQLREEAITARRELEATHDAESSALRDEITVMREQLVASEAELARLTGIEVQLASVAPALGEHQAVVDSLSWRITEPLRRLMLALRSRR